MAAPYPRNAEDVDLARGQQYALLSSLLIRSPDARMLDQLAQLPGDGSPLGLAHTALAKAAARTDADRAAREYFTLFVGLGRGELLPYASYYLTGSLQGLPLANLRQVLQRIGVERADGLSEPEDHAAILLDVMGGLASGVFPVAAGAVREFFDEQLGPWIPRFFSDLQQTPSANFYASVGALGQTFMEIERQALLLPDIRT